jgi:putative membrane protein
MPDMTIRADNNRFAATLLVLFAVVWMLLAIDPWYRSDWLLENVLVFVALPVLLLTHRRLPLSRISYGCIFFFLCLHEVGAHHTYAEVPYDAWWQALTGLTLSDALGAERNHFDRAVHFTWGLLLTYPIREVVIRVSGVRGFWGYLLPFLVVVSTSPIYELIEWFAAEVFGGELGMAYLGTQGDIWDAHKDTMMATLGGLTASIVIAGVHASIDRDFAREWSDSLTVKRRQPMGEYEIERLLAERHRHEGDGQ